MLKAVRIVDIISLLHRLYPNHYICCEPLPNCGRFVAKKDRPSQQEVNDAPQPRPVTDISYRVGIKNRTPTNTSEFGFNWIATGTLVEVVEILTHKLEQSPLTVNG